MPTEKFLHKKYAFDTMKWNLFFLRYVLQKTDILCIEWIRSARLFSASAECAATLYRLLTAWPRCGRTRSDGAGRAEVAVRG